jgi:hypothetical protein
MTDLMDDAALALATITVGLDRLRVLALGDTADTEEMADALRALYREGEPSTGALVVFADLIEDIALCCDDDGSKAAADNLGEAAAHLRRAGTSLRQALEAAPFEQLTGRSY